MSFPTNLNQQTSAPSGTCVILVRHGQSTYNAEKRHQGSSDDSVLTARGRLSAYQTGLLLRGLHISTVYVSPLRRAQETAQEMMAAIATETNCLPTVITHSALTEISLPQWEGLPYQVVREHFAEAYRHWKEQPDQFQMVTVADDSEEDLPQKPALPPASLIKRRFPVLELYERAQQFWQAILPRHNGETLLIVSHGGTNRALISTAVGMAPSRFHTLQQSNSGISILHFSHSGEQPACLELLNSTNHLGEILPKLKESKQGLRLLLIPSNGASSHRVQALAERLKTVEIDFSISNDLDCSQQIVEQLLYHHPKTVRLPVLREDFPQVWQQALLSRRYQASAVSNSTRLLTALVVGREAIARQLLSQLLEIPPQSLHLIPDTLSVIHYPQTSTNPIVQAMNVS